MFKKIINIFSIIIIVALLFSAVPFTTYAAEKFYDTTSTLLVKSNIELDAGYSKGSGTVQGGCTDGKYAYFTIQNGSTKLLKYDLSNFKLVASASCSGFGHANDMTYNSKVNRIVVANNAPDYDVITVLNPDTLEVTSNKKIELEIYSIAYNKKTNQYVVGISDSYKFAILDSEFNVVSIYQGLTTGYTRQGCECDDDYIYFPQSGGNNMICIYNFSGGVVDTMSIGKNLEVENMFRVGNDYYVTLHHYGNYIYRIGLSSKKDITYKVKYDANGGKGEMKATTVTYGKDTELSKCEFTKPGYTFAGWIVRRDYDNTYLGTTKSSDKAEFMSKKNINEYTLYGDKSKVAETTTMGSVTLIAQWAANTYTVKYDSSECEDGEIKDTTVKYYDDYTSSKNVFIKNGYVFTSYRVYRDYDKRYLGYSKKCDTLKWLDKKDISKYYEVKEDEKLTKLTYDGTVTLIPQFKSAYTYNSSKTSITNYCGVDEIVNIPNTEGITSISQGAFKDCSMKQVNIKSNINTISSNAFSNCKNLKEVYFDNYFPYDLSDNAFMLSSPAIYMTVNDEDMFLGWCFDKSSMQMIKSLAQQIIESQQ